MNILLIFVSLSSPFESISTLGSSTLQTSNYFLPPTKVILWPRYIYLHPGINSGGLKVIWKVRLSFLCIYILYSQGVQCNKFFFNVLHNSSLKFITHPYKIDKPFFDLLTIKTLKVHMVMPLRNIKNLQMTYFQTIKFTINLLSGHQASPNISKNSRVYSKQFIYNWFTL